MTEKEYIDLMIANPLIGWCAYEWDRLLNSKEKENEKNIEQNTNCIVTTEELKTETRTTY